LAQLYNVERLELEAISSALEPPPSIDYLSFAEQNIVFENGPFRGPFNRALFPFFDQILMALSPVDPCRYVTLASSAQIGKTALATVFALGATTMGQGAFLFAHPTEDNARRWSRMKLAPMMRSTAIVREMFPQRSRDSSDSVLFKERRDGLACLLLTGANSPASLSQVTVNNVVLDDLSKWEVNSAGDPETMCESRARAIADAKILKISTPLLNPGCRITKNFLEGSQEYPYVPCPRCGQMQILEWDNMLAQLDPAHPESASFSCVACGGIIEERHRLQMLRGFKWRAHNPAAMSQHRSFWIWSAYSLLQSWEQIAREYLKTRGDPAGEQSFSNDTLGKAYEAKGIGRPWEELAARAARSNYTRGVIPQGALLLTLGIDCQGDRVEWLLLGHGRQYRRFIIDYGVIFGHISEQNCQDNIDVLLGRKWTNSFGREIGISLTAIDANYATDDVIAFARRYPPHRLIAIRGANSDLAPRIARVERERDEKRGVVRKGSNRFFNIGVNQFKTSLYRDLTKDDPSQPGHIAFPSGCEDRLFQEIMGETRVMHKRMGQVFYRWEKIAARQATEMLDALVYASAAGIKIGVNAISDHGWDRLEAKFESAPDPARPPPAPPKRTMADFAKLCSP
jgi:phage terminase large subunit GpA-like protein